MGFSQMKINKNSWVLYENGVSSYESFLRWKTDQKSMVEDRSEINGGNYGNCKKITWFMVNVPVL